MRNSQNSAPQIPDPTSYQFQVEPFNKKLNINQLFQNFKICNPTFSRRRSQHYAFSRGQLYAAAINSFKKRDIKPTSEEMVDASVTIFDDEEQALKGALRIF
ncbi:hypothetical protein [Desulfonatronum thiodismutans]|uniref:hypothetical protein n=1 Tax=Desulfonatronum thiodismutans TaxID=159290 RepID=UPI0004ABE485|nr:hypothetical protein [Desulfonatronum thiodismutans]